MIVFTLFIPIVIFIALGALMGRWPPWELLAFSYALLLLLSAPYLFNMLVYYARVRMRRKAGSDVKEVGQRSIPLITLGVTICLACVIAYIWVLIANQWEAPRELRLLAIGVILGIGLIIRGCGFRG